MESVTRAKWDKVAPIKAGFINVFPKLFRENRSYRFSVKMPYGVVEIELMTAPLSA